MDKIIVDNASFSSLFKERLNEALKMNNMNKQKLCDISGVNKGTISKYYNYKLVPKIETIETLAKALNVNPAWLMGYDVQMMKSEEITPYLEKIISVLKTLKGMKSFRIFDNKNI